MPVVTGKKLHKAYGAHVVIDSPDVTVRSGERVGVVGKNGAGKSTLARILAGVEVADSGDLILRREASVLYLDQVPRFDGDPTAEQAVAAALPAWSDAGERHAEASRALTEGKGDASSWLQAQAKAAEDVERLGGFDQGHRVGAMLGHLGVLSPTQRVASMSGGEQRRVALARILIARPDLAILDEPTNHLDAETIEWLEGYLLQEYRGAVLLITHDRYLLDRVAQRTWEVADGVVHSYDGGYELFLERKAEREAHAARTEQNRQNFVRQELSWLRRQPKARTTKQKARVERAERALSTDGPKADLGVNFELSVARAGKTILELHDLEVGIAGKRLVQDLTLYLTQGDRLGIVGKNGSGKTTLLRTLLGELAPTSGRVVLGKNTRIAYFDQLRSGLDPDKSVFENVVGDMSRIEVAGEVVEPRSYLERFGFKGADQRKQVAALSGGERARVAMARMLRQSANLVVMDEPTNDLDVSTLAALEGLLVEMNVTALVVTHDRWFLDRVATDILAFEGEAKVVRYPGNYSSFRKLKADAALRAAREATTEKSAATPSVRAPKTRPKKLSFGEKQELAALPDEIAALEAKVAALDEQLADPSTYADGSVDVAALGRTLETLRAEVDQRTERWLELEQRKD